MPACSRLLGGRELNSREAHYRLLIDVPLFVVENLASNPLDRLQKGVEGRVAAPAQLILVGMDEFEKALGVTLANMIQTGLIARADLLQRPLLGQGREGVAIAAADMGQVDPQDPDQLLPVLLA